MSLEELTMKCDCLYFVNHIELKSMNATGRIMNRHPKSEEDSLLQSILVRNGNRSEKRRTVRFSHHIKSAVV